LAVSRFFAHGKLLLTGEYSALKGALALALPTRQGQVLEFEKGNDKLHWESFDVHHQSWFKAQLDDEANILQASDQIIAQKLQQILQKAIRLSGRPLPGGHIKTYLQFPNSWGLGSSSTLIHLISQWLNIDPIALFFDSLKGSGYDVACAGEKEPILYQLLNGKAQWENVILPEVFNEVYFIHLNQKKLSAPEVERVQKLETKPGAIEKISQLSLEFTKAKTQKELQELIRVHEEITADINQLEPVKHKLFSDYKGAVKSLGAWGGDFIMATGENTVEYFNDKGFNTIFPFSHFPAKKV